MSFPLETFWNSSQTKPHTRGKETKDKDERHEKETALFQQIDRLQMEFEWLKKEAQLL